MEIWPGTAYPLGATYDGSGTNFALFSEVAETRRAVPRSTTTAPRRASSCPRSTPTSGTATCPAMQPGPALRLPRARAVRARPRGTAATRTSCCSTPTPRRSSGEIDWRPGAVRATTSATRTSRNDARQPRRTRCSASSSTRTSTGATTGRRATPYHETRHLRGPRQGPHEDAPRRPRGASAARTPASPTRRSSSTSPTLGVTADRAACRSTSSSRTRTLRRQGPAQLLGLQHHRLLRPARRRTPPPATRGQQVAGVQGDGQGAARGRHRGHPRRRLQPHRRGQPPGPDAVLPGHRQRRLLPAGRRRPGATTMDYTGTGNSLNVRHPHVAAADHGLAALLGHRDARRRLPLRPRRRRWPAQFHEVDKLSAFFDLIQQDPVVCAGQADRRAVGRRRRRLPGRRLPAAVDRVERQVPRHRPRLLARRAAARSASSRRGSPGSSDLYEHAGRRPFATHQLRHRARRLHPARPRLLQRQAQRGQRRGQPRRRERTTARGTAASRARPTTRRSSRCAARQQRNFLATLLLSPGRADARCAATSSAAPRAATTTPTARTTRSPGCDWDLDAEQRAARVHRGGRQAPQRAPRRSAAGGSSPAAPTTAGSPRSATSPGCSPDGEPMERGRLGRRRGPDR